MDELITAVMVTGKNQKRYELAELAIENFLKQDYKNKKLVIVNDGDTRINRTEDNITETFPTKCKTLGALRNSALTFVPEDSLMVHWDDDDYRRHDYLSSLQKYLHTRNTDAVFLRRIMCYSFVHKSGLIASYDKRWYEWPSLSSCLFRKLPVSYYDKDEMEDVAIWDYIRKKKVRHGFLENDPTLYVKLGFNFSVTHDNYTNIIRGWHEYGTLNNIDTKSENYLGDVVARYVLHCPWIKEEEVK